MLSKTRVLRHILLLFSIFFYTSLSSQNVESENKRSIITHSKFIETPHSISDTLKKKDTDGDGIIDSLDKCPNEKGVLQYDGCPIPDSDNDGVADDIDECPTIAGLSKYKGCPVPDSDGDAINDDEDKCPNQAGVARYYGCPVGDADGDGVSDDDDRCIDTPGTVKNAGCPESKKVISKSSTLKKTKKK